MRETAASVPAPAGDTAPAKWRPPVLIGKDDTPPVVIPPHLLARSTAPSRAPSLFALPGTEQVQAAPAAEALPDGGADMASDSAAMVIKSLVSRCVDLVCGTNNASVPEKCPATACVMPETVPPAAGDATAEAADAVAVDATASLAAMEAALAGAPVQVVTAQDTEMLPEMLPVDAKPDVPAEVAAGGSAAVGLGTVASEEEGVVGVYETRHMADPTLVRDAIAESAEAWRQRALDVERVGGYRPAEVDDLLEAQQQFEWGDVDPEVLNEARNKLLSAKDWYADVQVSPCPLVCMDYSSWCMLLHMPHLSA